MNVKIPPDGFDCLDTTVAQGVYWLDPTRGLKNYPFANNVWGYLFVFNGFTQIRFAVTDFNYIIYCNTCSVGGTYDKKWKGWERYYTKSELDNKFNNYAPSTWVSQLDNYQYKKATLNTSALVIGSSTGVTFYRIGRVVIVNLYSIKPNGSHIEQDVIIASGLPKSNGAYTTTINNIESGKFNYRIGIKDKGTDITFWWNSYDSFNSPSFCSGQLIYITSDN